MRPTEEYIKRLEDLKDGDLGLLRTHAGKGLDETIHGFDLFTGIWWPLRQKTERAPRREVAWLIAKLYAFCPIEHAQNCFLPRQLRRCRPHEKDLIPGFNFKFDQILISPLSQLETHLQWALDTIAARDLKIDWAKLTDDLSIWERETTRLRWAEQFLYLSEGD